VTGRLETGRLAGRVALVTGAGSGIGRAVGRALFEAGAHVVALDLTDDGGRLATEIGEGAIGVRADVTDRAAVEAAVAAATETWGALNVLCNVAGITGPVAPTHEYPDEDYDRVLAVNLKGPFTTMRAALPALIASGSGSIINMASGQGLVGVAGMSAYGASKGGLIAMTRVVAVEYAAAGVRANVIAPGIVDTPMTAAFAAGLPPEAMEAMNAQIPLGRVGVPNDIAGLAVYLASTESSYMTGSVLTIDGGYTAH
jgi:NAD(P)-dependent dehydrogenase (short-subunit alcohol dehydrogenase family)